MNNRKFGWRRQIPDHRDRLFTFKPKRVSYAPSFDLRKSGWLSPIADQGNEGSCTANAGCAAFFFQDMKQDNTPFWGSRQFLYWNTRKKEGTENEDSGATIRDTIKSVLNEGICLETEWPYDRGYLLKPAPDCYTSALKHQGIAYRAVHQDEDTMKACIFQGNGIMLGFSVYESFMDVGHTGLAPMPKTTERLLGGHAVFAVGYTSDLWILQNSWGPEWGDTGFFYLKKPYLLDGDLSSDFWCLEKVET